RLCTALPARRAGAALADGVNGTKGNVRLRAGAGEDIETNSPRTRYLSGLEPECRGTGGQSRGQCRSPDLLFGRGITGAASRHSRGHTGPLRDAVLRQSEEIRPASDRDVPCAPDRARQVRVQV